MKYRVWCVCKIDLCVSRMSTPPKVVTRLLEESNTKTGQERQIICIWFIGQRFGIWLILRWQPQLESLRMRPALKSSILGSLPPRVAWVQGFEWRWFMGDVVSDALVGKQASLTGETRRPKQVHEWVGYWPGLLGRYPTVRL